MALDWLRRWRRKRDFHKLVLVHLHLWLWVRLAYYGALYSDRDIRLMWCKVSWADLVCQISRHLLPLQLLLVWGLQGC